MDSAVIVRTSLPQEIFAYFWAVLILGAPVFALGLWMSRWLTGSFFDYVVVIGLITGAFVCNLSVGDYFSAILFPTAFLSGLLFGLRRKRKKKHSVT